MNENRFSKNALVFLWEIFKITVLSLAIVLPIRYFLIQPFFVRGSSMEPSFENGEYLVIDELSYRFREPQRGEVIVFRFPQERSQFYIKRVIGLPNEVVEIKDSKVIIKNEKNPLGFELGESFYVPKGIFTEGTVRMKLDPNEYFVLGDNRPFSSDSRRWGVVYKDLVIGRVWIRVWPFNKSKIFSPHEVIYKIYGQEE